MTVAREPAEHQAGPDAGGAEPTPAPRVALMRVILLVIVAAVVLAAAVVPLVVGSLRTELIGREAERLYGFPDAAPIERRDRRTVQDERGFINVSVLDVDEAKGSVMVGVSGDRRCDLHACPEMELMVVAYNGDPAMRRGLPSAGTVHIPEGDPMFSESIVLPVEGWPGLYPFDAYRLRLGVIAFDLVDGEWLVRSAEELQPQVIGTLQNGTRDLLMAPPAVVPLSEVMAPSDGVAPVGVLDVELRRPDYLRALAVALVSLVAISALASLTTRTPAEALLGIGSLVLGVWGVRSVLVPSGFGVITAVDIALSLIILVLLIGLGLRAAVIVWRHSAMPVPRRR